MYKIVILNYTSPRICREPKCQGHEYLTLNFLGVFRNNLNAMLDVFSTVHCICQWISHIS